MSELSKCHNLSEDKEDAFVPGNMPETMFWSLTEISSIHSKKVILALRDHLVLGQERKNVCAIYSVNKGYFCTSLMRLYRIHRIVSELIPYYHK
ncbi:transcriptional regulator [Salmonella enterica]